MAKDFEFGLSYAKENRHFVEQVAEALAYEAGKEKVLFDGFMLGELNFPASRKHVPDIYLTQCEIVVVFLSEGYAIAGRWSEKEWKAIKDMLESDKLNERVFLVSFDTLDYERLGLGGDIKERIENRTAVEIAGVIKRRWYKIVRRRDLRTSSDSGPSNKDLEYLEGRAKELKHLLQPKISNDLSHLSEDRSTADKLRKEIDEGIERHIAHVEHNDRAWGNVVLVERLLNIAECAYHWHDIEGRWKDWLSRYEPLIDSTLKEPIARFDNTPIAAQVLNCAGVCHRMRSNFETARDYYVRAGALCSRDPTTKCDVSFNICDLERLHDKTLIDAEERVRNALSMAQNLQNGDQRNRKVARAYEMCGLVLARKREFMVASAYQGWAASRRYRIGDLRPYLLALSYQVHASGMWENIDFARDAYEEAERIAVCLNDVPTLVRLHGDMAETFTLLAKNENDGDQALQHWSEANRCLDFVIRHHERSPDRFELRVRAQAKLRHLVTLLGSHAPQLSAPEGPLSSYENWVDNLVKFDVRPDTVTFLDETRKRLEPLLARAIGDNLDALLSRLRRLTSGTS